MSYSRSLVLPSSGREERPRIRLPTGEEAVEALELLPSVSDGDRGGVSGNKEQVLNSNKYFFKKYTRIKQATFKKNMNLLLYASHALKIGQILMIFSFFFDKKMLKLAHLSSKYLPGETYPPVQEIEDQEERGEEDEAGLVHPGLPPQHPSRGVQEINIAVLVLPARRAAPLLLPALLVVLLLLSALLSGGVAPGAEGARLLNFKDTVLNFPYFHNVVFLLLYF